MGTESPAGILVKREDQMVAANLALQVVAQVVAAVAAAAILAEMIGESVSLVLAEHPRVKTEMAPTEERLHCVSKVLEDE